MLLFLFGIVLLAGCTGDDNYGGSYTLVFLPHKSNFIRVASKQRIERTYDNKNWFDTYHDLDANASLRSSDYAIRLNTSNGYSKADLDTGIPTLEEEIERSFRRCFKSNSGKSGESTALFEIFYCVDPIADLTISALDTPLFGKPAGASLNEYFEISKYDPDFIASYDSKRLLYGYTDVDKPTAIDEWLSLHPMAPHIMFLRLNATPGELPVTLRFKVDMETTYGIVVSDTTKVVTLTN
ncbi:MAG: hypothetical protein ACK5KP_07385 [Paludibacteraceae bacterium]